MVGELEEQEDLRAKTKVTKFMFEPFGIGDIPERLDTQGDLSSNLVAEGIMYHRTMADRFKLLEKNKDGKGKISSMITSFADRLSLLTWAAHRKSREEGVLFGRGMKEERLPLRIERLEDVPVVPPDTESKKRRRLP